MLLGVKMAWTWCWKPNQDNRDITVFRILTGNIKHLALLGPTNIPPLHYYTLY